MIVSKAISSHALLKRCGRDARSNIGLHLILFSDNDLLYHRILSRIVSLMEKREKRKKKEKRDKILIEFLNEILKYNGNVMHGNATTPPIISRLQD